jgi:acetyltransferase-like isoleucine patch superfamily enzyme
MMEGGFSGPFMRTSMLNRDAHMFKISRAIYNERSSRTGIYQDLVLGDRDVKSLCRYELIVTALSWIPGAFGLYLRSKAYPKILGGVGRNTVFGTNVAFRHPRKIRIGNNVVIDDNCLLDAKGASNRGIEIGDNVYLGRNSILSCKNGDIILEDHVNIGFNCEIFSSSRVVLEEYALVAAYCYLVGGGNYSLRKTGRPIAEQPVFEDKGITVQKNCWLGSRVTVLDGVAIGHDSVVGASSLVNADIPPFAVAAGIPAKILKKRE